MKTALSKPRQRQNILPFLLTTAIVTVLSLPVVWFVRFNPDSLRPVLQDFIGKPFGASVEIQSLSLHPGWPFRLEGEEILLRERGTGVLLLKGRKVILEFSPLSLLRPQAQFLSAALEDVSLDLSGGVKPFSKLFRDPRTEPREIFTGRRPAFLHLHETDAWYPVLPPLQIRGLNVRCPNQETLCIEEGSVLWAMDPEGARWQMDFLARSSGGRQGWAGTALYEAETRLLRLKLSDEAQTQMFEGTVLSPPLRMQAAGALDIAGLEVREIMRQAGLPDNLVSGRITAQLQVRGDVDLGKPPSALVVRGVVDLRGGKLHDANLVRSIIKEMLLVHEKEPGAFFQAAAGGEFFALLNEEDLNFEILQTHVEIVDNILYAPDLRLRAASYVLEMGGKQGLESHEVDFLGRLVILEPLSRFLTEKFPEFASLQNAHGRMVVPFRYVGLFPNAVVRPDVVYIKSAKYDQEQTAAPVREAATVQRAATRAAAPTTQQEVIPARAAPVRTVPAAVQVEPSAPADESEIDWFKVLEEM